MNADELKVLIKKYNAQATQSKMDLHDLSEELPLGWEKVLEQAQKTYDAYARLSEARKQLAALAN